jgi:hypothetical protein
MIAVSQTLVAALAAVAFSAAAATASACHARKSGRIDPGLGSTIAARGSQLGARSSRSCALTGQRHARTAAADELLTRATLRLRYVGSPALAPGVSHVRLALNGDTIATLPFSAATAGTLVERAVEVDSRLLIGFNKLTMTLIATPGSDSAPGTEAAPGLWADIAASSELELTLQPLVLADDLAILPEPFFDAHDQRRLVVPFAFGAKPSQATLRAAADVASWLGVLARWRGVRTPPSFDAPTTGHTVAFVANDERPSFLASVPPATGPELRLITHPGDAGSKLLLVMGRNGEDLKVAADALVSGIALSGPRVQVKRVDDKVLAPYEAPAWVALGEPTKLGDLTDWAQQLEASGRPPQLDPVKVDMRLPPDLAAWRGPGIPLTLKLQYTPPACATDAYLEVAVNDQLIQSVALRFANEAIIDTKQVFIPYYRLRSRMELALAFRFPVKDEPQCRDPRAPPIKAVVLPESTIDFTGIPHYVRMPNLAHFATIGYPFTRRADLADTVVVLPDEAAPADIETMLSVMARMGEATGRAATRAHHHAEGRGRAPGRGHPRDRRAAAAQSLLARWTEQMPITFSGIMRASVSTARMDAVYDWLGLRRRRYRGGPQVNFEERGPRPRLRVRVAGDARAKRGRRDRPRSGPAHAPGRCPRRSRHAPRREGQCFLRARRQGAERARGPDLHRGPHAVLHRVGLLAFAAPRGRRHRRHRDPHPPGIRGVRDPQSLRGVAKGAARLMRARIAAVALIACCVAAVALGADPSRAAHGAREFGATARATTRARGLAKVSAWRPTAPKRWAACAHPDRREPDRDAQATLERLRAARPGDPAVARYRRCFACGPDREKLRDARNIARRAFDEAVQAYRALFPRAS